MTREQAKIAMREEICDFLNRIGILSTGNTEKDEAHLLNAAISESLIQAGYCPNGCGKMKEKCCHTCGFTYN